MEMSEPIFTPEALRNLAKDNGPEYAGRSRRALRWCADVIEAADAVVQESAEVRKQDDALILQLVEALEKADKISGYPNNRKTITAGRARLEGKP